MKKKAIEEIPYMGLKRLSKKAVDYIAVVDIKKIQDEEHLFIEVYQNKKECKKIPAVRIVLTKKDFGTYIPETEEWSRKKILNYGEFAWSDKYYDWQSRGKKNILQNSKNLEKIKKICGVGTGYIDGWWMHIEHHQDHIMAAERNRANDRRRERRRNALIDRMEHTEALDEKMILEKTKRYISPDKHYLYYKKNGAWVQVACSKCGGVKDGRWKAGESYESQFGIVENPREGDGGICPLCQTHGIYKCQGKAKSVHTVSKHFFLGQQYKENGMVMRYIEVSKSWVLELIATDNGEEMHGAYEEYSEVEIARAYFKQEKEVQIDYHKHNPYIGQDFWDDCNLSGLANITIGKGLVLAETYENIKNTDFRYCAMEEYIGKVGQINPIRYLERYQKTPQIEVLVKMGLIGVVKELLNYHYGIVVNENAKRADLFLGIRKEQAKLLIKKNGNADILSVLQTEKRMNQRWTAEQVEQLAETGLSINQIYKALEYMTIQKLLNHIKHYAECDYGTNCSRAISRIRHVATTYTDYLSMRNDLGYDMTNTVYLFPRNLVEEHEKMILQVNKDEAEKQIQEANGNYPNISKQYRTLRNKYYYEDENYIIRPAKSAGEIVMEGRLLHHCVGGSNYLSKHNDGKTYILMLRFKNEPEIPYITVEITANTNKIIQWYGERDKKPDKKNMQKWLDEYLRKLNSGILQEVITTAIA